MTPMEIQLYLMAARAIVHLLTWLHKALEDGKISPEEVDGLLGGLLSVAGIALAIKKED